MSSKKARIIRGTGSLVIGESGWGPGPLQRNPVQRIAKRLRSKRTKAEETFEDILLSLNNGVLKGRFVQQYVVKGVYIVDFFIPEIRLGIEIDGSYHERKSQEVKDAEKEKACKKAGIFLVRFTNHEVFGDREALTIKLRDAWRTAKRFYKENNPPHTSL